MATIYDPSSYTYTAPAGQPGYNDVISTYQNLTGQVLGQSNGQGGYTGGILSNNANASINANNQAGYAQMNSALGNMGVLGRGSAGASIRQGFARSIGLANAQARQQAAQAEANAALGIGQMVGGAQSSAIAGQQSYGLSAAQMYNQAALGYSGQQTQLAAAAMSRQNQQWGQAYAGDQAFLAGQASSNNYGGDDGGNNFGLAYTPQQVALASDPYGAYQGSGYLGSYDPTMYDSGGY